MPGHLSTEPMTHIASVSSRLAGQQAAVDQRYSTSVSRGSEVHQSAQDQRYISQQRTSGTSVSIGPAVKYISQQRTCGRGPTVLCSEHVHCASVSRGPAVHQSAQDQLYCSSVIRGPAVISQQRTSSTSVSRGSAVRQSAENQQYISQQMTNRKPVISKMYCEKCDEISKTVKMNVNKHMCPSFLCT